MSKWYHDELDHDAEEDRHRKHRAERKTKRKVRYTEKESFLEAEPVVYGPKLSLKPRNMVRYQ